MNNAIGATRPRCGPEVKDWFDREIAIHTQALALINSAERICRLAGGDKGACLLAKIAAFGVWAARINYKYMTWESCGERLGCWEDRRPICPSVDDKNEIVTFCGVCLDSSILGNFMFGIGCEWVGFRLQFCADAARQFHALSTPQDTRAFILGYSIAGLFRSKRRRRNVCDYLQSALAL